MRGIVRHRLLSAAGAIALVTGCGGSEPTGPSLNTSPSSPTTTVPSAPAPPVAEAGTFVKRTVTISGATYPYQVFVPAAYTAATRWPIILSMHGGGSRGSDNTSQMQAGLATYVTPNAATFPAFAVFPQIPTGTEGQVPRSLQYQIVLAALDSVIARYAIDTNREYITGVSMGGSLTYELAYEMPNRWAAAIPVSAPVCDKCITGNANAAAGSSFAVLAGRVTPMPVWIFHGRYDSTVPVATPRGVYAALQTANDPARYTEFTQATAQHNAVTWDGAYQEPGLWPWLFAQRR